jgi:hypothetical protein
VSPHRGCGFSVRLKATPDNRDGLGARVGLVRQDGRIAWRQARTDGSYLSANDPRVHFAVPGASRPVALMVEWSTGSRELWRDVRPDRSFTITLEQGTGRAAPR